MKREISGELSARGLHIGIASASWNQSVTDSMRDAAVTRLEELNVEHLTILQVPGALELPLAAKKLAVSGCDAVIAIGTVVKGDTDHYEIVVRESTNGVAQVAIETGVPIANAILAVHDFTHAAERAGPGSGNKGVEAAEAAVMSATALAALSSE